MNSKILAVIQIVNIVALVGVICIIFAVLGKIGSLVNENPNVDIFKALEEALSSNGALIFFTTVVFFFLLIARTIYSIKFIKSFAKLKEYLSTKIDKIDRIKLSYFSAIQLQLFSLVLLVLMPLLISSDAIFGSNTFGSFIGSLDAAGIIGGIVYAIIFVVIEPLVLLSAYVRLSRVINRLDVEEVDFNALYLLPIGQLFMLAAAIFIFVAIINAIVKVSITILNRNLIISGILMLCGHIIFVYCFFILHKKMTQVTKGGRVRTVVRLI